MLQEFIIVLVLAVIAFEMIEHIFLPIFWFLLKGRKRTEYSHNGMKGKIVVIKCWKNKTGIVLFHAERWHADSDYQLLPGEKAIVEEIFGLTLKIKPFLDTADNPVILGRAK